MKAYDSVTRKALCNILIIFGVPMKIIRLIKMLFNESYGKFRIGKHWSDKFYTEESLNQGDVLSPLLYNFVLQ
jgi:hypothetical protein